MENISKIFDIIKHFAHGGAVLIFGVALHITLANNEHLVYTANLFFYRMLVSAYNLHLLNALVGNSYLILLVVYVFDILDFSMYYSPKDFNTWDDVIHYAIKVRPRKKGKILLVLLYIKYLLAVIAHYWLEVDIISYFFAGVGETGAILLTIVFALLFLYIWRLVYFGLNCKH
ncbi:MAG: hypothetical protein FWB93_03400 [Oscillospiraceae bacterium]|nr:hypothetical protein [Oscillospiraceae bacterium]